jgi:hypothetical protein
MCNAPSHPASVAANASKARAKKGKGKGKGDSQDKCKDVQGLVWSVPARKTTWWYRGRHRKPSIADYPGNVKAFLAHFTAKLRAVSQPP